MVKRLKVRTENEGDAVRGTEAAVNVDQMSDLKDWNEQTSAEKSSQILLTV